MQGIDEILELAKVLEPVAEITTTGKPTTKFCLVFQDGKWWARVDYHNNLRPAIYMQSEDKDSPEQAIEDLRNKLTAFAKRTQSWLNRTLEKLGIRKQKATN